MLVPPGNRAQVLPRREPGQFLEDTVERALGGKPGIEREVEDAAPVARGGGAEMIYAVPVYDSPERLAVDVVDRCRERVRVGDERVRTSREARPKATRAASATYTALSITLTALSATIRAGGAPARIDSTSSA